MRKRAARLRRQAEGGKIMRSAVVNLGAIVTGDIAAPFASGDTVLLDGSSIARVGTASAAEIESCDVVIDAGGATAIPGLIDSHVHTTLGDYTPRQKTVGFLESYLHGGVTTAISASEAPVPAPPPRPPDRSCRGQGARGGRLQKLRKVPPRRHARARWLDHS